MCEFVKQNIVLFVEKMASEFHMSKFWDEAHTK